MKLRDMYDQEELPTRPDNPRACAGTATRCQHCGHVFGDHSIVRPGPAHLMRAGCAGLRKNFKGEATRDADRER